MKRDAFTMIEVIFVMVIIGILAAVGIPKIAGNRSDARASVISTRLSNCIVLAGKSYLQDSSFDLNETNCKDITILDPCYVLTANDENGTLFVKDSNDTSLDCQTARIITTRNALSSVVGKEHKF